MLRRDADLADYAEAASLFPSPQFADDWRKFDGFRPGAEDGENGGHECRAAKAPGDDKTRSIAESS